MKKKNIIIVLVIILITSVGAILLEKLYNVFKCRALVSAVKDIYYCAMHPDFTSDKPGSCSICGMTLVKKVFSKPEKSTAKTDKKIIFYRNPMDPQVTSPVPMKDSMGMDYAPVYAEGAGVEEGGVSINSERQQIIGVKKEKVEKRKLTRQILTVGKVAYDPGLYVAQEEYLQAVKAKEKISESALPLIKEQTESLVETAKRKLILLGMGREQVNELAKSGTAQENLYLPVTSDSVWVYIAVYEYEMGLIKEGIPVEIEAVAFPGEVFIGKIAAIKPVLDAETRSIQARAEIKNPQLKLKPEMFVNAKIKVELGEELAVPETAVLDTGLRKIVYLVKEGDIFESREVTLGQKAEGYFEVLDGLKEGDVVVTSGNFLVDSESKLKGAVQESSRKHGQ